MRRFGTHEPGKDENVTGTLNTDDTPVWRPLRNEALGFLDSISNLITELESQCPRMLTSVRRGPRLLMASDYSGDDDQAPAKVYSFLLADAIYLWLWLDMRAQLRKEHLPGGRRMSYKNLNDKHRQSALIPFLRIANAIPGLLITFIVDKEIHDLFGHQGSDMVQGGLIPPDWKGRTVERMVRIATLGGLIIAGMSAPGQDVLWFTDEDDIVANMARVRGATRVIGGLVGGLSPHPMGHLRFGTAKCDNGSREVEDLLAIPDLVSGALSNMSMLLLGPEKSGAMFYGKECPEKAQIIMSWVADATDHTLKKLVVCLVRVGGNLKTRCINFSALVRRPEFFWYEEAREFLGHP